MPTIEVPEYLSKDGRRSSDHRAFSPCYGGPGTRDGRRYTVPMIKGHLLPAMVVPGYLS